VRSLFDVVLRDRIQRLRHCLRLLDIDQCRYSVAGDHDDDIVCHLTEPLGLSQPTVSHHLKVLLEAGLVEREQRGNWAYFRVCEEPLASLRELLS
jgi:DNA-binding transcriptional ArsR family regulator